MTLANRITLLRAFMSVLMFVCIVVPGIWTRLAALAIFALASITDWVDGYLARKTNTATTFGAIADPFVDKLLIGAVFVAFASIPALNVPLWAVFLIIAREMMISSLRVLAAIHKEVLAADRSGKFKTAIQMISSCVILIILNMYDLAAVGPENWRTFFAGAVFAMKPFPYILTIIVTAITWGSGIMYLNSHWAMLKKSWSIPQKHQTAAKQPGGRRRFYRPYRRPGNSGGQNQKNPGKK